LSKNSASKRTLEEDAIEIMEKTRGWAKGGAGGGKKDRGLLQEKDFRKRGSAGKLALRAKRGKAKMKKLNQRFKQASCYKNLKPAATDKRKETIWEKPEKCRKTKNKKCRIWVAGGKGEHSEKKLSKGN